MRGDEEMRWKGDLLSRYSLNNMIDIDPGLRCVFTEDEKIE